MRTDGGVISLDHVVVAVADLEARAKETAALTRAQILNQAGTSVLATANLVSQNVLALLG